MYLNSFLFPAPKCSYTVENLKDELIWIPKYQKKQNHFTRLHTTNDENTKNLYSDTTFTETPRNMVPQMKSKKQMPYASTFSLGPNDKGINQHKILPKTPIINDQKCQNHPKKVPPKLGEISECSIPELSAIYDERSENNQIQVNENHPKLFLKPNPIKSKDPQASYNVSMDDGDHFAQPVGANLSEKKFFLSGSNLSSKVSKANIPTRESTLSTEVSPNANLRSKAPLLKKRGSKKLSQTFTCGDETPEADCDYDEGIVNEYPTQVNMVTSPRNITLKYQTRLFNNPHSLSDKSGCSRKVMTEYSDTCETQERPLTPTFDSKSKFFSRMSLGQVKDVVEYHIPCLILKSKAPVNRVILYFHGNGEDINLARELLTYVRDQLDVTVIAMEYPGYGLYKGTSSEEQIQIDSEAVFDYLTTKIGLHPRNIVLFGRSIGSGPATWLASRKNIGALVIMSAFTSIRAVVQHLAGKWAQYLIKERFNNLDHISRVTCPTLIVHGLKDRLIPYKHSQELHSKCKGLSELVLPKDMDHIEFDFHDDFTAPLYDFLTRIRFGLELNKDLKINLPPELFQPPKEIQMNLMSYRTPRY